MNLLEAGLYDLARLFLAPVLILILLSLFYSFVVLGMFLTEAWQRWHGTYRSRLAAYQAAARTHSDDLEVWILHQLEWLRIVSRTSPMLGLVATMIPLGPALLALSNNEAAGAEKIWP